jgi:hypothetical protein
MKGCLALLLEKKEKRCWFFSSGRQAMSMVGINAHSNANHGHGLTALWGLFCCHLLGSLGPRRRRSEMSGGTIIKILVDKWKHGIKAADLPKSGL